MKHINPALLSSCALLAVALGLGACAMESGDQITTARYEALRPDAVVRDAQIRLTTLGDYNGPVDGLWGPATDAAVTRFQRDRHLVVTARLDDPTRDALEDATATRAVNLDDPAQIRSVQIRLHQMGFYNGPADGVWGADTQAAMESFQRSRGIYAGQVTVVSLNAMGLDARNFHDRDTGPRDYAQGDIVVREPAPSPAPAAVPAGPLEPRVVRGVQRRLSDMGFYHAGADGVWGPATRAALAHFQESRGLDPSGDLTPRTASMLGLNPNDLRSSVTTYRR